MTQRTGEKTSELDAATGPIPGSYIVPVGNPAVASYKARKDSLSGYTSVTEYSNIQGDGVYDCTTGITSAVATAAATGTTLFWPAGTYLTTASIPLLHTVRHRGPGVIKRGSDLFYAEVNRSQSNTLYVSASGVSANDGLSSSQPTTLPTIPSYLYNYGPSLQGTWTVVGAAGTYSPGAQTTIDGLKSLNPILIRGPSVAYGVPTMIVDGTGTTGGACGIYLRNGVRATVRDIKFQNFSSTDAMGITADRHCELLCDNVHSTGNDLAGINAESHTRLYVTGGTHANNNYYNIRAYGQCLVSIGYNSSAHRVTIGDALHAGGSGILVRDNSSGHIDYCDISGVHDGGGVELINQARAHFVSCVFGGSGANYYNVKTAPNCTFIDDGTNTFNAATAKSIVQWGFGIDSTSQQLAYYDLATGWFKWGRKDSLTPKALFDVQDTATAAWGGSHNSNVLFSVCGGSNAYIGLGAGNAGECGFMFADVAGNRQGQIGYLHTSDTIFVRVNAVDSFRLHSTYLKPEVDNAVSLGVTGQTFQKLWLNGNVQLLSGSGTPEGAVTANVGSIYMRTNGGAGTSIYVKESGTGNTGWVGK